MREHRTRALALGIMVALGATGLASCDALAPEEQLAVTTTVDGSDAVPGDGVCEMTLGMEDCSLRAAIDETNANPAIVFVDVPAGTYQLAGVGAALPAELVVDPASGHVILGGDELGVVVDANGAAGGIAAAGGQVVTYGFSVTGSAGAGFTARNHGDLHVISGSPHGNAGPGVLFETGSTGQVVSSTVSANGAGVVADGMPRVVSSTITDNGGPGLSGAGSVRVTSSIVVHQAGGPSCVNPVATLGWNIFGDGACGGGFSDVLDPGLELVPQQVAGVPAFVAAPAETQVRDVIPLTAGACSVGATVDQAGTPRPHGSGCDIGAVEADASAITFVVDSPNDGHDADPDDGVCNDGSGGCTLRAAIDEANIQGGATASSYLPVVISIAAGVNPQIEWYNTESLVIAGGVTIEGGGAIVDLGQSEQLFAVLHQYLEVHDLTFTNGTYPADPVISNWGTGASGASITLDHVTIDGEDPTYGRGYDGVAMSGGNLVVVDSTISGGRGSYLTGSGLGSVLIERSTLGSEDGMGLSGHDLVIRDTTIDGGLFGGVAADPTGHVLVEGTTVSFSNGLGVGGPFTVRDSTFVHNEGGIAIGADGTGTIERSTFAGNNVPTAYSSGVFEDIRVAAGASVTVTGNIFAGSTAASLPGLDPYEACAAVPAGASLVSGGFNVVADTSCGFAATGDVEGVDVGLNEPDDNGGLTQTLLPMPASPAIGRIPTGTPVVCDGTNPVDQRGVARPQGTDCDSGSVEVQDDIPIVVDSAADAPDANPADGVCDDGTGACTLRAAAQEANAQGGAAPTAFDPVVITIAPGVDPVLDPLVGTDAPIVLGGGVTIEGGGARIDLGGKANNLQVQYKRLTLHDLTITGAGAGPAVTNAAVGGVGAPVILDGVTLSANDGDGVWMEGGILTVADSTIEGSGSAAVAGSATYAELSRTSVVGNQADLVLSTTTGLYLRSSRLTDSTLGSTLTGRAYVFDSTIDDTGGVSMDGIVYLVRSTMTGNDHGIQGNGIIAVQSSTVADNNRSGNPAAYEVDVLAGGFLLPIGSIISSSGYAACRFAPTAGNRSDGSNLGSDTSCRLTQTTDRQSTNPLLAALGDNGGSTPTRMTQAGSPAVDAVPLNVGRCRTGETLDQRGVTRPQGPACDVGAVER